MRPVPCACGASSSIRGCPPCFRKYLTEFARKNWRRYRNPKKPLDVVAARAAALEKAIEAAARTT